jgi:hypothetical protein
MRREGVNFAWKRVRKRVGNGDRVKNRAEKFRGSVQERERGNKSGMGDGAGEDRESVHG